MWLEADVDPIDAHLGVPARIHRTSVSICSNVLRSLCTVSGQSRPARM